MPEDMAWIQPLLLMIALGTVIMITLKQARELKKLQEEAGKKEKILTIVKCGDSQVTRDFKEGDYIGKEVDECGEEQGVIVGIYAVKEETQDKKARKSRR